MLPVDFYLHCLENRCLKLPVPTHCRGDDHLSESLRLVYDLLVIPAMPTGSSSNISAYNPSIPKNTGRKTARKEET